MVLLSSEDQSRGRLVGCYMVVVLMFAVCDCDETESTCQLDGPRVL